MITLTLRVYEDYLNKSDDLLDIFPFASASKYIPSDLEKVTVYACKCNACSKQLF